MQGLLEEVDLPGARVFIAPVPATADEPSAKKAKVLTYEGLPPHAHFVAEQFIYRPTGVPNLPFNPTPKIKDEDEETRSRLVFLFGVNLRGIFLEQRRYPSETANALGKESSGTLNWMIERFVEYKTLGLNIPEVMIDLQVTLLEAVDPVGDFIEDCCTTERNGLVSVKDMYRVDKELCERTSSTEFHSRTFATFMLDNGYKCRKNCAVIGFVKALFWSSTLQWIACSHSLDTTHPSSSAINTNSGNNGEPEPFLCTCNTRIGDFWDLKPRSPLLGRGPNIPNTP